MRDRVLQRDTIRLTAAILIALVSLGITIHRAETAPWLTQNDLTPDYVSAKAWIQSQDPYAPVTVLMDKYVEKGAPYYSLNSEAQINSHPPIYLAVISPLALLPLSVARIIWLLLMATFFFVGLYRVGRKLGWNQQTSSIVVLLFLALPVVNQDLLFGQVNCLLMFLLVCAWLDLDSGRERRAGIWLGLATALKFFPAFLMLALFRRRARIAIVYQIGTTAILTIAGTLLLGLHQSIEFVKGMPRDAAYWRGLPVNISLTGHIYRWLTHNRWHWGAPDVPALAHTLEIVAVAMMVAVALRGRHTLTGDPFWACVPMMLLITPLSWVAGLVMVMPIVLILLKAFSGSSPTKRILLLIVSAGLVIGPPQALLNTRGATPRVFVVFAFTTLILIVLVAIDAGFGRLPSRRQPRPRIADSVSQSHDLPVGSSRV